MMYALLNLMTYLAVAKSDCTPKGGSFFGLPPWWEYLTSKIDNLGQCAPVFNFPNDIMAVALAVVDILLRLAGLAAVISIIIAGVAYITSIGSADKATAARKRIQNSLIGLAIVVIASTVVAFIGNSLG